jgi:hypothetical protein
VDGGGGVDLSIMELRECSGQRRGDEVVSVKRWNCYTQTSLLTRLYMMIMIPSLNKLSSCVGSVEL